MCGIAAIYAFGRTAESTDRDFLTRACDRMRVRGPDGEGAWWSDDQRTGLGHRRLAIIDLSERAAQPMQDESEALSITFNGEIYNYRELRRDLEAKGYTFRTQSDTEVLLHLYADRGESMVLDLRGMFAFALWDQRRRGLLLARDPFGIKPLYYALDASSIRIASEVKALLAGGGVNTSPEPAGHAGFFLLGSVPEPYTLFRGIRALPGGSTMWVDEAGAQRPSARFDVAALFVASPVGSAGAGRRDVVAVTRELLLDSVRAHLVADVEVGVFLSAGLDSTSIAALAAEVGGRLRTITLGFEEYRGTAQDETVLAERVAASYGSQHETVWIRKEEFRSEFDRLLDRMDQPTVDGVNSYFVARAAHHAGLKVALSGLGGDEIFGGYSSFKQVPRLARAVGRVSLFPFVGRAARVLTARLAEALTSPKYAGVLEYGGSIGGAYLLRRALYMPWELDRRIAPDVAREGLRELNIVQRMDESARGIHDGRLQVTALESAWYLRNQLLRDADWASMSHSLEVRVPFVDWRLWGAIAGMFRSIGALPSKQEMAASARPALPPAVLTRPKSGFSVPVREWLTQSGDAPRPRGLRGWSTLVHEAYVSVAATPKADEHVVGR